MITTLERPKPQSHSTEGIPYRPGAIILYPGRAESVYRVKSGLIRLHTMDNEGNGLTLRYVKPDEYFGEEAIAGLERYHFAESVTESVVEVYNVKLLSPECFVAICTRLAVALNGGYVSISRLVTKRLRARIAAVLLELSETALGTVKSDGQRQVFATHDELAAAVGSVRETVTKVIGELVREGAIDSGYGKITLRNYTGLQNIALE
jgi:CRP/FNR family transcriptional regulator, cyclic AMP receptor protein